MDHDSRRRLTALAQAFPSLAGIPGVEPFDADTFAGEALGTAQKLVAAGGGQSFPGRFSAIYFASAFVCAVWMRCKPDQPPDATDSPAACHAENFDLLDALATWAPGDVAAFAEWTADPWPMGGIRAYAVEKRRNLEAAPPAPRLRLVR